LRYNTVMQTSYAWALLLDKNETKRLSAEALEGLDYARALAEDARERSYLALSETLPPRLTPVDLAVSSDVSASTIRRRIKQARHELFGSIGTSAIYARQARTRLLRERARARCSGPDCENPLPHECTERREYCSVRCRVRAHRARRRGAAE
jgi:hypothetical protein